MSWFLAPLAPWFATLSRTFAPNMLVALFLAPLCWAINSRELPQRITHNRASVSSVAADVWPNAMDVELSPESTVHLQTDWIKEFLAFRTLENIQNAEPSNTPLNSKFTNLERTLLDDSDLRSWTRFIVDHNRDEMEMVPEPPSAETVDLQVDEFIEYLVEHRGFQMEDLFFLRRVDLDYGYDEIEDELNTIRQREAEPRTIDIGGVVWESSACRLQPPIFSLLSFFV